MKTEIHWNGVTGSPSEYESPDGDMSGMMNLWREDGELKPVLPPRVQFTFPSVLDVIYVHEARKPYKHVLFVNRGTKSTYWCDYPEEGAEVTMEGLTELSPIEYGEMYRVESVGNTLMVLTDTGIHHYLWKDDGYKYLGTHLPELDMQFGLAGHVGVLHQRAEGELDVYYGDNHAFQDVESVTNQVFAVLNKFVQEQGRESNNFTLPFLVRYAYRMYDETLTMHSAPVLMMTSSPHVLVTTPHDMEFNPQEYRQVMAAGVLHNLVYRVATEAARTALQDWTDIVKAVDVFVSSPIYTYDASGKVERMDLEIGETLPHGMRDYTLTQVFDAVGTDMTSTSEDKERKWELPGYGVYSFDQLLRMTLWGNKKETVMPEWVRRSDVCVSEHSSAEYGLPGCRIGYVGLPWISGDTLADRIKDIHTFYLLKSIPVEELPDAGVDTTIKVADKYLVTLEEREVMTDDYRSHDTLTAEGAYVFNGRMHYYNTKRTLYSGYGHHLLTQLSVGQGSNLLRYGTTPYKVGAYTDIYDHLYEVYRYYDTVDDGRSLHAPAAYRVVAQYEKDGVEKNLTDGRDHYGLRPVFSEPTGADTATHELTTDVRTSHFAPLWYLYFLDRNIKRVLIREQLLTEDMEPDGEPTIYVWDNVKPHDMLNGSVKVNAGVIGVGPDGWEPATTAEEMPVRSEDLSESDGDNVVYTSEPGNPFLFKASNVQTIGTGRTIAFASAVRPLSEGQFGQFPLYAFTTEGVWSMALKDDGTYKTVQPVTRDVCTSSESIVQLDTSVLFAANRGIMQLEGSRAACITETLDGDRAFRASGGYNEAFKMPKLSECIMTYSGFTADHLDQARFKDYIRDVRMIYDYTNQRVVLFNPGSAYGYVYSIGDKSFGMLDNHLDYTVSSYPEAYAVMQKEGEVRRFVDLTKLDESVRVKGFAVSRALKMGSGDLLKTVNTVIVRGALDSKSDVMQILYGSRDLVTWYPLWSSSDIYLRGFRGTPYKYFRLAMLTEMSHGESIYGATVQWEGRLNNQPR